MNSQNPLYRLLNTIQALRKYLKEEQYKMLYDVVGRDEQQDVKVLQNIIETCRLELIEQRKLGISIPEPEPWRTHLSWYDALTGMDRDTYERNKDGKGTDSNSEG